MTKLVMYPLDEVGQFLYRKLKLEALQLKKIQTAIKHKKRLIEVYTEMWLDLEAEELDDDADSVYYQKLRMEIELASLERDEKQQLEKVRSYACA